MAVRRNGMYNDPYIGAAATNIAQMFAPPSASDQYNAARAVSERQKAQALADYFRMSQDASVPADVRERWAIGAGLYNPTQSFYAVDANNRTELEKQRIAGRNAIELERTKPITVGEGQTVLIPDTRRQGTSLPDMFTGGVKLNEGQQFTLPQMSTGGAMPGNPIIKGAPKSISGSDIQNALLPDGSRTMMRPGPDGIPLDAFTGQPLPAGTTKFGTNVQGTPSDVGIGATKTNITEANKLDAILARADAEAAYALDLLKNNPGIAGVPGAVFGLAQDAVSTLREFGNVLGGAPDAAVTIDQVQNAIARVTPNRNPAIQDFRQVLGTLAYVDAQLNNPGGEVSRQAFERSYEKLAGGLFNSNDSARDGITSLRGSIQRARSTQVDRLRNPQAAAPAAAPQGADPVRVNTPEEAMSLPPGTKFVTPDGRVKVRP